MPDLPDLTTPRHVSPLFPYGIPTRAEADAAEISCMQHINRFHVGFNEADGGGFLPPEGHRDKTPVELMAYMRHNGYCDHPFKEVYGTEPPPNAIIPPKRLVVQHQVGEDFPMYKKVVLLLHHDGSVTWDTDSWDTDG